MTAETSAAPTPDEGPNPHSIYSYLLGTDIMYSINF